MYWFYLSIAIISEVFASSMLKLSDGFSKTLPSVGVVIGYLFSFYFLSLALKGVPLSSAYAIWAGLGIILTAIVSVFYFGQKADIAGIIGIFFILCGVVILNLFSQMAKH